MYLCKTKSVSCTGHSKLWSHRTDNETAVAMPRHVIKAAGQILFCIIGPCCICLLLLLLPCTRKRLKRLSYSLDTLCLDIPFSVKFLNYTVALQVSCWNKNESLVLQSSHDLSNRMSKSRVWLIGGDRTAELSTHLPWCCAACACVFLWFENKLVCTPYRRVSVQRGGGMVFLVFYFLLFLVFLENCPSVLKKAIIYIYFL